ncbi:hypothetical protein BDW62DRAFT_162516 [Aspergillus aurantiobrunneus]
MHKGSGYWFRVAWPAEYARTRSRAAQTVVLLTCSAARVRSNVFCRGIGNQTGKTEPATSVDRRPTEAQKLVPARGVDCCEKQLRAWRQR